MSEMRQTEELLERIVRDAEPRRAIPRIRVTLSLLAGLSALVAALYLRFWVGLRPDFTVRMSGDLRFAEIWLGLLLLAGGAATWAIAASVPGRGALERVGRGVACVGALLGFLVAPVAILLQTGAAGVHANTHDFFCMGGAFRIAALPGVALIGAVLWAAPAHPARAALCAALGTGALGAAVIHATCPDADPSHWMMGHALAPLVGAALVALPVWALGRLQRRWRRRPL